MDKEWKNLEDNKVWRYCTVREWKEVAAEYRKRGEAVHMGRLFGIMVEKGSELPKGHVGRKFKYRVVFGGHAVVDQFWEAAVFQDLGASPATMPAGKNLDYWSCLPGHSGEQADAQQAYCLLYTSDAADE